VKDLPLNYVPVYFDKETYATWSYDNARGMLVGFDTVDMARKKADYIRKMGLGGAMWWWKVSGDGVENKSLIASVSICFDFHGCVGAGKLTGKKVVDKLAGADRNGMESRSDWLCYPDSSYDNIKSRFVVAAPSQG
jgi:chitinase